MTAKRASLLFLGVCALTLVLPAPAAYAHDDHDPGGKGEPGTRPVRGGGGTSSDPLGFTSCGPGNQADVYPCRGIDLYSFLPLDQLGAGPEELANDIWGWTDPVSGRDFALFGLESGTSFVDVTAPTEPKFLGKLPTHSGNGAWRDVKVYQNHAYIVADGAGNHGMQVFDLEQLRDLDVDTPGFTPVTFAETAHYDRFANAHNIAINEESGFAYAVGSNTFSAGLHFVDLSDPANPVAAGGYVADTDESFQRYTHDTQVINYHGPDPDYQGREIALNSNQEVLNIADVTDKDAATQIAHISYPQVRYTHQGWLTDDHRFFLMNDESDERLHPAVNFTHTHIWDVSDLDDPVHLGFYAGRTKAIDHNLYVYGDLAFEANYRSGLRVLDLKNIRNGDLTELGFFDVFPENNDQAFSGAWSVFRFESSGTTIVSGIESGLYVLDTSGIASVGPTPGLTSPGFERVRQADQPYVVPDGAAVFFSGNALVPDGGSKTVQVDDLDIVGWFGTIAGSSLVNPTDSEFAGASQDLPGVGVPEGVTALRLRSHPEMPTIRTRLADLLEADTLYTLELQVGQALSDSFNAGYDISLWAGEELLGRMTDADPGAVPIPVGSFATTSLEIDSRQFSHLLGEPLEVRLASRLTDLIPGDGFTYFDAVSLSAVSLGPSTGGAGVPEPAGSILFLLPAAVLLAERRRLR